MNIALVTDSDRIGLTHDDLPLIAAFARKGDQAIPTDWADPAVPWETFDAIVIRSPWDYHARWRAFEQWLSRVELLPLWNPAKVLRWNLAKTYLLELEAAGLPVIPSLRLPPDQAPSLAKAIERWGEIIVKPEVGAGGAWTYRANADSQSKIEELILPRLCSRDPAQPSVGFLVQPFLPKIFEGEWSLVYLDGVYSHAVRKTAASGGQFLIHEEYGGRVDPGAPTPDLVAIGDTFAAYITDIPYMRVDLVGDGADALLVELELVEPELFFRFSAGSDDKFVEAIRRRALRHQTA